MGLIYACPNWKWSTTGSLPETLLGCLGAKSLPQSLAPTPWLVTAPWRLVSQNRNSYSLSESKWEDWVSKPAPLTCGAYVILSYSYKPEFYFCPAQVAMVYSSSSLCVPVRPQIPTHWGSDLTSRPGLGSALRSHGYCVPPISLSYLRPQYNFLNTVWVCSDQMSWHVLHINLCYPKLVLNVL